MSIICTANHKKARTRKKSTRKWIHFAHSSNNRWMKSMKIVRKRLRKNKDAERERQRDGEKVRESILFVSLRSQSTVQTSLTQSHFLFGLDETFIYVWRTINAKEIHHFSVHECLTLKLCALFTIALSISHVTQDPLNFIARACWRI